MLDQWDAWTPMTSPDTNLHRPIKMNVGEGLPNACDLVVVASDTRAKPKIIFSNWLINKNVFDPNRNHFEGWPEVNRVMNYSGSQKLWQWRPLWMSWEHQLVCPLAGLDIIFGIGSLLRSWLHHRFWLWIQVLCSNWLPLWRRGRVKKP